MAFLELALEKLARLQKRYALLIFIIVVLITGFLAIGVKDIRLQTDLTKEMPQDLPIFQLNNKISDTFGGQDTIIILFRLDDTLDIQDGINDIRHPYVIQSIMALEAVIKKESSVDSVTSAAQYFRSEQFYTLGHVKSILDSKSSSYAFFSRDYKSTLMYIKADVGSSEEKIIKLAELIQGNIDSVPGIPGVKVSITGNPPMRVVMMQLLSHDAGFTLLFAALIILILLFIMEKSFTKGLLVFTPLMIGLIWTMGTMGWLKIPLSIATVGLGAMILGLGVEYGVFMLTRYNEEREKGKSQLKSLIIAVPGVGSAIFGSGMTTIVGFLALTLSVMPMMQHLGQSLALGIAFSLVSAIVAAPVIIILAENFEFWYTDHKHQKLSIQKENHARMKR
ncbi:MAG: MMPL family transporter [Nanoarchaeota archaeon]